MIAQEMFLVAGRSCHLITPKLEHSRVDGVSEHEFGEVATVPDESRLGVKHLGVGRSDAVLLTEDDTQGGIGRFTF